MPKTLNEIPLKILNTIMAYEALRRLGFEQTQIYMHSQALHPHEFDAYTPARAGKKVNGSYVGLFLNEQPYGGSPDFVTCTGFFLEEEGWTTHKIKDAFAEAIEAWNTASDLESMMLWNQWCNEAKGFNSPVTRPFEALTLALLAKGISCPNLTTATSTAAAARKSLN